MVEKTKKLSKKQLAVLDELFNGELDEQAVLDKYNVSRNQYYKWLTDKNFTEQFDRRIAASYQQSAALIARYATLAAAKLVQLTESENQETARKACLDIISRQQDTQRQTSNACPERSRRERQATSDEPATGGLSPETASKILEVLAQKQKTEDPASPSATPRQADDR